MLDKIKKITSVQASIIIVVIGIITYFRGLFNPFIADDISQIVNNIPVHSIKNFFLFFTGGTYYNASSMKLLSGIYYRPLMTVTYSLLYTLFGTHTFAYHALQLVLFIGSTILIFLIFKFFFNPALSLFLSLVFLVHPINSQIVYAIPSMQEVLMSFFGLIAIYILIRFSSIKSLFIVALFLFLSLLSKETAIAYILMAVIYLIFFDRNRLKSFITIMVLPVISYLVLRISAVGLDKHMNCAPIINLNLISRLMTVPSIILFYITKFIFPLKLATAYYWVYPKFSFEHVLVPLLIDTLIFILFIYLGVVIYKKLPLDQFLIFIFFAVWAGVGLFLDLQLIPLDMTACETWFYFSMVGVLGMIGVIIAVFPPKIKPLWILLIAFIIIGSLGLRSSFRAHDYRSQYTLAFSNIAVTKDDYLSYDDLSQYYINQRNYNEAVTYAELSINAFPSFQAYNTLGEIYFQLGDYKDAQYADASALHINDMESEVWENFALAEILDNDNQPSLQSISAALKLWPQDGILWYDYAILEYRINSYENAKNALSTAERYGNFNPVLYKHYAYKW